MTLQHLLMVLCVADLSTASRFEYRRGADHITAPYFNKTTQTETSIFIAPTASPALSILTPTDSSRVIATAPWSTYLDISPTGRDPGPSYLPEAIPYNTTRLASASCTVNVLDASLDWWYPPVYFHPVASVAASWGNYSANSESYTLIPETTTFDATSAIQTAKACTHEWITYTAINYTAQECIRYTEKPTAASTAVLFRSAVPPLPSNLEIAQDQAWLYDGLDIELPPMTTAVSIAPNVTAVETMPTPFVRFSAYEIARGNSTKTIQLGSMHVEPYPQDDVAHHSTTTGVVPSRFMNQITQSACEAGRLVAVVTVIVVVEMYYPRVLGNWWVHPEEPASGWEETTEADWGMFEGISVKAQSQVTKDGGLFTTEMEQGARPTAKPDVVGVSPEPTRAQTVGSIGTVPIVVGPSPAIVVGSQTLWPGGSTATVEGTPVALVPSAAAIVVGDTSFLIPAIPRPGSQMTIGTLGNIPVVVGPSAGVIVGTQTLQPGSGHIIVGPGTTVSLVPTATAVVVGATTSILQQVKSQKSQPSAPPAITLGSKTIVPNAATQYWFAPGQILTPGGTVLVEGTRLSLDISAAFVMVGSSTEALPLESQTIPSRPQLVFGGSTFTALATRVPAEGFQGDSFSTSNRPEQQNVDDEWAGPTFVISGQTLVPGGVPITLSGSTLSLAPSGAFLVIDGSTTHLATPLAAEAVHATPPPLTIGNGVFKPLPGTGTTYQVGAAMLTPGGSVVVAGTTISLAMGATALVINGVTTSLLAQAIPSITNPPLLTIGHETYTAVSGSITAYIIGGQTLTPGGTITVEGTTIVLSPFATELIYGVSGQSKSTALFPATTSSEMKTTAAASASEGQSGGAQAAPTSSSRGVASQLKASFTAFAGAAACMGWLLT
ncbi:hypothetical protein E8E13_008259 [Curvularia kusanoi]|uniref:Uncharacterized protein n=1 Tax=Curvularia kusanoi TaxID=90978 RepID=A0A9P4TJX1_CURKU|nr:hypothetical protein E8E13_008259 [Curvularia kusanoi]